MPRLCIDIGNSFIKAAVFEQNNASETMCFPIESLADFFSELISLDTEINNIITCSVSEEIEESIKTCLPKANYYRFTHTTPLPLTINYKTPSTLGLDRIASAVAGFSRFPDKNVLIIGLGTCIIYDFVANQTYLGGHISPGLRMRFKALNAYTARLPLLDPVQNLQIPGKSTQESIQSGVMLGIISEIDGFIDSYKHEFGSLEVILSGGDLIYFDKTLKNSIFAAPNIVLEGLNIIAAFNEPW